MSAPLKNRNRAKDKEQNLKPVTIRLYESQLKKLRAMAIQRKITYNELLRQMIDEAQ